MNQGLRDNRAFTELPEMHGEHLILRPLRADDAEALYQAASDPLIWEQHPDPLRYQRERFTSGYLNGALASGSALLAIEKASGDIVACSRYYDWVPEKKEVAIGYTFIIRSHWGGKTNAELKALMLAYAFRYANRVWLHIGKHNWRSRKGSEKIGAVFSHEAPRETNGQLHDYAYYYIDRPCLSPTGSSRIEGEQ